MKTATISTDLHQDAAKLHQVLNDLLRVYQFRDRDRICCHDLSVTQCYALETLVSQGPLTVNELASHLYLDKSTASRVVDALARKKLLQRLTHPEDKRAVHLKATPAGEAKHRVINDEIINGEARLIEGFEPEVRSAMIDLIRQLGRAAAERVDTTGGSCCCID